MERVTVCIEGLDLEVTQRGDLETNTILVLFRSKIKPGMGGCCLFGVPIRSESAGGIHDFDQDPYYREQAAAMMKACGGFESVCKPRLPGECVRDATILHARYKEAEHQRMMIIQKLHRFPEAQGIIAGMDYKIED